MLKTEDKHFIFDKPRNENFVYKTKYCITVMQCIGYKVLKTIFRKKASDDKKYYVSICGIFKDEAFYLKEWIEYHKKAGVDHIYLYNNNSTDNYLTVIKPYLEEGYVDLIDWPKSQAQMEAYHDCFNRFRNETSWLGFIDIDEFIVPIENKSVKEYFKEHAYEQSILIYWKMFGSNSLIHRDTKRPVTKDFTSCWYKYDDIGKCFINTEFEISDKQPILHHMLWTKRGAFNMPPVNCCGKMCPRDWYNPVDRDVFPIQINHYVLKSYDEYMSKVNKSDVMFTKNPKGEEHFRRHDRPSTSTDFTISKFLEK